MIRLCPACGQPAAPGDRYCEGCGSAGDRSAWVDGPGDPWGQVRDAASWRDAEPRRPSRVVRIVDAVVLAIALVAILLLMSVDRVDAYPPPPGPPQVCTACPTPRPTPIVVGLPVATPSPAALPTIPPTDTED